jgi:hypothetical protein
MIIRSLNDVNFKPKIFTGAPDNPSASAVKLFNGADFEN